MPRPTSSAISAKAYHKLKQSNDYGLPPETAEQVKARCAELFPFYGSQVGCIEMEAKSGRFY